MAIRRTAWEDTGGFDERLFLYLEETEWQARLRTLGWQIELVPDAEVVHAGRGGDPDAVPSVHFVDAVERYLALRGAPRWVGRTIVGTGITSSRLGLRIVGLLGTRGQAARRTARSWDALWRDWRSSLSTV
jgi:GT2 family glycosyltransferase